MHGPKFNDWNEIATRSPGVFRTKEEGGILGMRGVTDYIANPDFNARKHTHTLLNPFNSKNAVNSASSVADSISFSKAFNRFSEIFAGINKP